MANVLPIAEMTAEQEATLRQIAVEAYENWQTKGSEEVKQTGLAEQAKFQESPEHAEQKLAVFRNMFNECDVDGDGRLNLAEYKVLKQKAQELQKAGGRWVEPVADHDEREYALFNEVAGGEEGFTFEQQLTFSGKYMQIFNELKAAGQ